MNKTIFSLLAIFLFVGCQDDANNSSTSSTTATSDLSEHQKILNKYVSVKLTADLSLVSSDEKKMIGLLMKAADIMDDCFWYESYGDKIELLGRTADEDLTKLLKINYGPYDRLGGNKAFMKGFDDKPIGANFYPEDMTKEEFEAADLPDKKSLYTFIRRDNDGSLITVPYYEKFDKPMREAAFYLAKAADLSHDDMFRNYLNLRAKALLNDEYQESDMAWLDMKHNLIDMVVGPIENYEDQLFGYKAAHEAYILIKDKKWSKRLEKYAKYLPDLQKGLPVPAQYKAEEPGRDVELNAYDVVYYAGDCNAGSKTIAINLPNDEEVQLKKGTRRLQLKNAMKAKFDKILVPISDVLIAEDQRKHITFDAFFSNTMFHEVAHGLGIKNTINGSGTVRESLKELHSALEEGKADILGLYMIQQLHSQGELTADLKDFMVTFMAGIFRSVRFGASSAHGKANMIRFNYFNEAGAFTKNKSTGRYSVNFEKLQEATASLTELILTIQGDGDYNKCKLLVEEKGLIGDQLQEDLNLLNVKGIPVDVVFKQGPSILGI